MARRGASFAWLLRLFLAGAAVATLGLLYTTHAQHAVDVLVEACHARCATHAEGVRIDTCVGGGVRVRIRKSTTK